MALSAPSPETGLRRRRQAAALAALAVALCVAGSARTETGPLPEGATQSDVEKFCTGIADAARDRRYSLQAMELKKLKDDVDERIKQLEAKRADYEDWMKRREAFIAHAQDDVVKIYATMKPDAAAERLAALNPNLAAAIVLKLDSRKAGVILNEMNSAAAATLTGIMAAAARREDKT